MELAGGTRGCRLFHPRGVVQAAGDRSVLLTQVGTRLAPGAVGKHTCLGRAQGCFGIPAARASPSSWSLKSLLGRRELWSCTRSPLLSVCPPRAGSALASPEILYGCQRAAPRHCCPRGKGKRMGMLQALGRSCVNRGLIQAPQYKGKNVIGLLSTLVLLWVLGRREKSPTVPHGD